VTVERTDPDRLLDLRRRQVDACASAGDALARAQEIVARCAREREARQFAAGRRADDARRRGALTVPELWWRFMALGGTADLLELEGFFAGVMQLAYDQQVVLGQTLRERRFDLLEPTGGPRPRN
jgi:hypothetical protein